MSSEFLKTLGQLENMSSKSLLSAEDLEILSQILSENLYQKYFFCEKKLSKNWFDILNKLHLLSNIPTKEILENGKFHRFEQWWAGKYLVKVAGEIPEKVASVLREIETENYLAIDDAMQAVLKMPLHIAKDFIPVIDTWLDIDIQRWISEYVKELLGKFIQDEDFDSALKLFQIILKPVKKIKYYSSDYLDEDEEGNKLKQYEEIEFRCKSLYVKEILDELLLKLIQHSSSKVFNIAASHLKTVIQYLREEDNDNFSASWRPAIEDHPENWDHDKPEELLTDVIRCTIDELTIQKKWEELKPIIENYLVEKHSIFPRLAFYALTKSDSCIERVKELILSKDNMFNSDLRHEYFGLVREKWDLLRLKEKKRFFHLLNEGPDRDQFDELKNETFEAHKEYLVQITLSSLGDKLDEFPEYKVKLEEIEKKYGKEDYPDITHKHKAWFGPTSPLSNEEIEKMEVEDFIEYIKNWRPTPDETRRQPSPEGLARDLEKAVEKDPEKYAIQAFMFFDPEKIYPTYPSKVLFGLQNAIRNNRSFPLNSVLELCERLLETIGNDELWNLPNEEDYFHYGAPSETIGFIARFIEELMNKDSFEIKISEMNRIKEILRIILTKHPDPDNDQNEDGTKNREIHYVDRCINTIRGKALHAMICYSLRFSRKFLSEEERKKTCRLEPDVKQFLKGYIIKEKNPAVLSSFGQFLPYLFYLDKEWVTEEYEAGRLLPKVEMKAKIWKAQWQGFIGYANFYSEIYSFLKEDFRLALESLGNEDKEKDHIWSKRLAEHLMIAYWNGIEKYEDDDLVTLFFQKASKNIIDEAIAFLGQLYKELDSESEKNEKWILLKELWEKRIQSNDRYSGDFGSWYTVDEKNGLPESPKELKIFIIKTVGNIQSGFQEEDFIEYIEKWVEIETECSIEILLEFLKCRDALESIYFRIPAIKNILLKAKKTKSPKIKELIEEIVSQLGEMGYFETLKVLEE